MATFVKPRVPAAWDAFYNDRVLRAAAAVLQSSEPASGEGAENPLDSR